LANFIAMHKGWLISKRAVVFYHIAFWILFLVYPYLIRMGFADNTHIIIHRIEGPEQPGFRPPMRQLELIMLTMDIYNIATFYITSFILIPKYFNRKYKWRFALSVFIFYLGFLGLNLFVHHLFFADAMRPPMLLAGFPFIFVQMLSIAYSLVNEKIKTERKLQERANIDLISELQFLRSQISPHFIFNVLNNMVSLARKGSDHLEPSLIKLSELMRYMLYEVKNNKIRLSEEINLLHIYIDLQQQRRRRLVKTNFTFNENPEEYLIEPMLLIPFIENAFKHSHTLEDAAVSIEIVLTKAKLLLNVTNDYDSLICRTTETSHGIGLANVKRRLQILYGGKSDLQIIKTNSSFQVLLIIEMEQS
jgi:two-component system LytT family sensor kinase